MQMMPPPLVWLMVTATQAKRSSIEKGYYGEPKSLSDEP